ncbi:MAG TPA: nitrate/sulfonate/bicarbonate ABC transporter ATP-binding protein [Microthrixaceae bacterium]|nr:nitrate/sulfonate/bicarbonate ABC transporter ATP-binding protein [Microthrixaceae bacterium]
MTGKNERAVERRDGTVLLSARGLKKSFDSAEGPHMVLDGIDMDVRAGEIVALLGKSGSGKSTLLRLFAGLIAPSQGSIDHRGRALTGTNPGTSMVFQSFALLPWETVQQNVELGLQARGVPDGEASIRALHAIDLIGLDGFESAYPKELSGGMRQRVGFARAIVTDPEVLLMDEPFSALDVLTAENLRGELLEIWERTDISIQAIVIVTHNIEEAVLLADRIVVLGSNPGRIKASLEVDLPRPRDRRTLEFEVLVNQLYRIMTGRDVTDELPAAGSNETPASRRTPVTAPLPLASVDGLSGLAEILADVGRCTVAEVADDLGLEVDDFLPLVDALEMLDFAEVEDGRIALTSAGETFAGANIQASKEIFASAAQRNAPLIGVILNGLTRTDKGVLRQGFFRDILRGHFNDIEVEAQLDTAIDWGRYSELYEYDADHDELMLPD